MSKDKIPRDAFIIIIGAMKAGTTTLFETLKRHPQICPARTKEPEFFSRSQIHGVNTNDYDSLFDFDSRKHKFCLEASTGYTKFPLEYGVPERIFSDDIYPLLIYSVRNPIDRIESEFNYSIVRKKKWSYESILDPRLLHNSMYYMQIREYIKYFPESERYFIVDFEDITNRLDVLIGEILDWAGLDEHPHLYSSPKNVTRHPSALEAHLRKIPINWKGLVPENWRGNVRDIIRKVMPSSKQTLSPREREMVRGWIRSDVARFGEHFGFPVHKWGF